MAETLIILWHRTVAEAVKVLRLLTSDAKGAGRATVRAEAREHPLEF